MNNTEHVPLYGEHLLHECPDGSLIEFRRDHAYSPDLYLEWRYLRSDGEPYKVDGGKWSRVVGESWDWIGRHAADIYNELRAESL